MDAQPEYLFFTFAPHVLEDLGVNLYTSVEKALVEFVANSYDADSRSASISFDEAVIKHAKDTLKANFKLEQSKAADKLKTSNAAEQLIRPLAERTLPDAVQIVIEDDGDGMTRSDMEHKFLVIGRRRRKGHEKTARTKNGRIIMGRKGLGKLAGFGIAHVIEVTSKVEGEPHATRITLNLDELLRDSPPAAEPRVEHQGAETAKTDEIAAENPARQTQVSVPVETVADGAGLTKGTRIVLKRLVYDALRGDLLVKLRHALAENFFGIEPEDFTIKINNDGVETAVVEFAFAYPDPTKPATELIKRSLAVDGGPGTVNFEYRIRLRPPKKQLPAKQRGVRVYAHHRLASAPDLLDVKSSAHGFRYTSYLDGVVVADFIDDQPTDYISTDRQTLRWDTPILTSLRDFLTVEISKALTAHADLVSEELDRKLKQDEYTSHVIAEGHLPPHREEAAWQLAKTLAREDDSGLEGEFYRSTFKSIVSGLGHGDILAKIQELAEQKKPELQDVIREITRLTRHEFDEFVTIIEARLRAIETLSKLVESVDFKAAKNEDALHVLFERSPWLIDPTFFEFLSSDETENALANRLTKTLEIGRCVPAKYDATVPKETESIENAELATNERPDLTFLLCNESLNRVVVVELKAPNTPLHIDHLIQLKRYMAQVESYFEVNRLGPCKVEGILIGSHAAPEATAKKVFSLRDEIKKQMGPNSPWRVFDIQEVLKRTQQAHKEIWDAYKKASQAIIKSV